MTLPRVVIAAPASGHGKTTVATGLMAALRRAGHAVSGHKIGPDYIDPGYHALATGRPGRNLDPHLVGEDLLVPLLRHGAAVPRPADIAVVEGVMGLFDGAIGRDGFASTAHVAAVLDAPVILVVDISASARTVGAVVHGLRGFDSRVRVAGVILNKAGRSARRGGRSCGAVDGPAGARRAVPRRRDQRPVTASRPGAGGRAGRRRRSAGSAGRSDRGPDRPGRGGPDRPLGAGPAGRTLESRARGAPRDVRARTGDRRGRRPRLHLPVCRDRGAVAGRRLPAGGVRPARRDGLPSGTAALYLGGGFPEVHAAELAGNEAMRRDIATRIGDGLPTVAECAGLLYLCREMDGAPMVGAVDARPAMTARLTLGYRDAVAASHSALAPAGTRVTGHEFHRTTVAAAGGSPAWLVGDGGHGFALDPAGTGSSTVHASYLHVHWAGHPTLAARFATAARAFAATPRRTQLLGPAPRGAAAAVPFRASTPRPAPTCTITATPRSVPACSTSR